jgi:hypothetical protein
VSRAFLALLAAGASLIQVGAMPALFLDPAAAPLLPVALLAGWGVMRSPDEVWPGLLIVPLPLGLISEERLGWFILALLPTAALLLRKPPPEGIQTLGRVPLVAALGAAGYLVVLWVAAGEVHALTNPVAVVAAPAVMTALLATVLAALLWPVRTRRAPRLFR